MAESIWRRRFGNAVWDAIVRGSIALAVVAIGVVLSVPQAANLVWFSLVTIWVHGPISPWLPATYEPILMLYGREYPPVLLASIGSLGSAYIEYFNYHLYERLLRLNRLSRLRARAQGSWVVRLYRRRPFLAVWLCALSPIPDWTVRILSPLTGFPAGRHALGFLLGRFPKFWLIAALGTHWMVDKRLLLGVVLGSIALALLATAVKLLHRKALAVEVGPLDLPAHEISP